MSVSSAEVWKQRLCLFFFSAVGYMLFLHSHHVTDLRLAESCVICRLYSGRTEALSCSEFHGEIHGDCIYLFLCRVSIYIGLWVGGAWEMKTASMDWTTESKEQGVGPLKKLPDQTSARQVCLRWLSWSPGWPWACYCWGWPLVPHPPSLPPKC